MQFMDENPVAVIDALNNAGCTTAIHGHTHRPATHTLQAPGGPVTRIVLPDWDYEHEPARAGWPSLDAQGLHMIQDTRFCPGPTRRSAHQPKHQDRCQGSEVPRNWAHRPGGDKIQNRRTSQ